MRSNGRTAGFFALIVLTGFCLSAYGLVKFIEGLVQ